MENYLEKNWKEYFKDLKGLVKIPTFLEDVDDYPNDAHRAALKYMEDLAKANGMKAVINPEGYYGYIEIGQGKEMIALLCHLDVVAPGDLELWKDDPFNLTETKDFLIGRGTDDDKGPTILSFYLLKELVEKKVPLNKRIRMIMATDEETLWRGMNKYVSDGNETPTMGWAPDTNYPPLYGEKALLQYALSLKEDHDFEINGGTGINTASPRATYKGKKVAQVEAEMKKLGFKYEINKDGSLSAIGEPTHAMMVATEGINANSRLVLAVSKVEDSKFLKFLAKYIGIETTGDTLFRKHYEDEEGAITNNFGVIKTTKDGFTTLFDSRVCLFAVEWPDVEKAIIKSCKEGGVDYKKIDSVEKLYIDKNGEFIQTLLNAYKDYTGDVDAEPMVVGGASYARTMPNCVAFGPFFPDSPDAGHKQNEYIRKSDFITSFSIYNKVIDQLLKK